MGQISKKLARRFTKWSGRFRQAAKTVPIPEDVRDVETLVKDGHDPLHAVYASVQNITSVFAECVSVLPELEPYYDVIAAADDEYMPSGPPMSPLTGSYFTTWAFFDFRFGGGLETIGTCLMDVSDRLGLNPGLVEAIRQFQESRMGIYEHCGTRGGRVRLRELVTGQDFDAVCTSGYAGKPGELWYVRLCPPILDLVEYKKAHYPDDRRRILTCGGTPHGTIRVEWLPAAAPGVDVKWDTQLYGLVRLGNRKDAIRFLQETRGLSRSEATKRVIEIAVELGGK